MKPKFKPMSTLPSNMNLNPSVKKGLAVTVIICLILASCLALLHVGKGNESSGPLTSTIFDIYEEDRMVHFNYESDYMFDEYLKKGSVYSQGLTDYLADNITVGKSIHIHKNQFCSALMVEKETGDGFYTGRNFDYFYSEPAIVHTSPEGSYSSVSIVDMSMAGDIGESIDDRAKNTVYNALPYIPLDGVNEKGVFACINVVHNADPINESESIKTPIFITSAIRLILDNASTTQEAVDLVMGYNLNYEVNCHLFVCDRSGDSRSIEVVDNRTVVTPTEIMTNHYITVEGADTPISESSRERYDTLEAALESKPAMSEDDVKAALISVQQTDSDRMHFTRWSSVYNLDSCSAVVWIVSPQNEEGEMDYDTPHRFSI